MDLNDDGQQDILSGSYSRMGQPMAGLFQVLWGNPDGTFQTAKELTGTDGKPLEINPEDFDPETSRVSVEKICTRPTAVDWDNDGDLDLVVGNFGGSFYVFLGEGQGKFSPTAELILVREEPLKILGAHSDPFVVDWDRDGDLDLLSGSSQGGVQWAENVAEVGQVPVLKPFEALIKAGPSIQQGQLLRESDLTGPMSSTRVWVDDVNGDGKLDILVGDNARLISPAEGMGEEEYQERYAAWQEQIKEASQQLVEIQKQETALEESEEKPSLLPDWLSAMIGGGASKSPVEQARERLNNLYAERSEFMQSESTGFVWLYVQK